jgi:hypothetical protein
VTKRSFLQRIGEERQIDPFYAHVLLHGLAHIYKHTPHPIRVKRLAPFRDEFPELVRECLSTCSQIGKATRKTDLAFGIAKGHNT